MTDRLHVDDDVLGLPPGLDPDAVYDVVVNGHHAWSVQPRRDAVSDRRHHGAVVPWPKLLRPKLVGRAEVTLREHVTQAELGTTRHVFRGEDAREVSITDKYGYHLVVDKYGRLTRPLSAEAGDLLDGFLDQVVDLLAVMHDEAGVPAFVSYGTLLGAVRNGRLIGHDNDIDLAYLSGYEAPVDVVREGYRVERALVAAGYVVRRGSGTRLNVRLPQPGGGVRFVDVFTAHWTEGVLYMPSDTGFRLPPDTITPLGTVTLHDREVPAPGHPDRLLAATYGPGWRTPDPSFKYETPTGLARRLNGWFGGLRGDRKHWDTFYSVHGRKLPQGPSDFARWVARHQRGRGTLVDLGTGNGRDARFFARRGRDVLAVDDAMGMLRRWRTDDAEPEGAVRREVLNLNDLRQVLALGVRLSRAEQPPDLYGRFLVHTLTPTGRENLVRLASMSLRRGGRLLLEFRTPADRQLPHAFEHARRRYVDPDRLVADLAAVGGRVEHREEGRGLAVFGEEDPQVCRLVVTFSG